MNDKHYIEELSAFLNQELSKEQRQKIAEHIMQCDECRREHDALKLGSSMASNLRQSDAPGSVWANIEEKLEGSTVPQMGLIPQASFFNLRKAFAFAVALIAVSLLSVLVYLNLFSGDVQYTARTTNQNSSQIPQQPTPINTEVPANGTNSQINSNINASNTNQIAPMPPVDSWQVETIAGSPKIGDGSASAQIAVGQLLETDGKSKAKITVADIGSVEIAPNSRVKLVGTDKTEHRLSLERGQLHAKIFAPPRLFVVDTPSGKAVDLGCEYTLVVDRVGNSILSVTGGFVALEDAGRESIVPAGMMCLTRKGKGLGTPFSAESDHAFKKALEYFDFFGRGSSALQAVLGKADFYDMITLWHLLSRASKKDRGLVYDALAKHVPPPPGVTREGIIDLNRKMLADWRTEVENVWFN
ncbi:MAG: FecR domain-containing protein [Pyrinomonadaceae bacterium]